jgi:RimJ/RimL family protein N-acetyltransferase
MIAYRIVTPRLVLRCWQPSDAPLLLASITGSLEHLRKTMIWAANEPVTLDEKAQALRKFRAQFDSDQDYLYGVFDRSEREVMGGCGLHRRVYEGGLEIGYWMDARHLRKGYATELTAALTRVCFEVLNLDRAELHILESNLASQGVARKLGFVHEATLGRRCPSPQGMGPRTIWTMFREHHRAQVEIEAYDALDRRVI